MHCPSLLSVQRCRGGKKDFQLLYRPGGTSGYGGGQFLHGSGWDRISRIAPGSADKIQDSCDILGLQPATLSGHNPLISLAVYRDRTFQTVQDRQNQPTGITRYPFRARKRGVDARKPLSISLMTGGALQHVELFPTQSALILRGASTSKEKEQEKNARCKSKHGNRKSGLFVHFNLVTVRKIALMTDFSSSPCAFPIRLTDARGKEVYLEHRPRRLISLVPSQTELLADLGLDREVVGITRFCVHPSDWKKRKAIVGGTKQVRIEKVQALCPDLVLANKEENTREDVEQIERFAPVYVTDVRTLEEALGMMRTVGRLTGTCGRAQELVCEITKSFSALPTYPPLRVLYLIWRNPFMTVGGDTFIHDILQRAGLVNVAGQQTRYPVIKPEQMRRWEPEVVLLSNEPYPFAEKHLPEIRAILPQTPVFFVDGELFSWYGSRLRFTPSYIKDLRNRIDAHVSTSNTFR